MRRTWDFLQIVVGLIVLGALALGVVTAFQALGIGPAGAAARTPQGYPPPQATGLATQPPPGYPPPQATVPAVGPTLPPQPTLPAPTTTPSPSAEAEIARRYVAEKYGLPAEAVIIAQEHRREYRELGRAFQAVTLLDPTSRRFFDLLVDLQDHAVVEDISAVERAEAEAYQAHYGKLERALYERLQAATEDELVEVAIWVAGQSQRSQEELFAELAAQFPEAKLALEQSGKPFDVPDPEVQAKIEQAYSTMLEAEVQPLLQPVVAALQAQRYPVKTYGSLPSVVTALPKGAVLALARRPDVGRVFLIEGELQLLLDSAVSTDRVPVVWQQGIDGTGRSIAILEGDNVDFSSNSLDCPVVTNNCFLHPGITRGGVLGIGNHATFVASVAASNHSTYKGVSPDVTIHSAGLTTNDEDGLVDGLKWALASALCLYNGLDTDRL